jgi:hypothetical protein
MVVEPSLIAVVNQFGNEVEPQLWLLPTLSIILVNVFDASPEIVNDVAWIAPVMFALDAVSNPEEVTEKLPFEELM